MSKQSTTTEPTGPYTIRRNVYGHAEAIERDGYTVLHLNPGTERNEQEVQGIVDRLNGVPTGEERVRELPLAKDSQRNIGWTIDPNYLNELQDKIGTHDDAPSWEGIELVLLAHHGMTLPDKKDTNNG